jgi:hypothetical protein
MAIRVFQCRSLQTVVGKRSASDHSFEGNTQA